jgi:hypothetical protein
MATRIVKAAQQAFPKAKPAKSKGYLEFVRQLPCCVTGKLGVEAAHLSYANSGLGHFGRGKGRKAPDRWALPLSPEEHRKQHGMNEILYWAGVNETSPHLLALALWGLWTDLGDDAEQHAVTIIDGWRGELPW